MRYVNETYGFEAGPYVPAALDNAQIASLRHELGQFFRNLRMAVGQPLHFISAFLLTEARTLEALEHGDVRYLPEWPETERIVGEYAALAGLNPTAILGALQQLIAYQSEPAPAYTRPAAFAGRGGWEPAVPNAAPAPPHAAAKPVVSRSLRPRRRVIYAATLPILLLVAALNATMLEAAVTKLHPGVMHIVDKGWDFVVVRMAPERAGFRWIEVEDPRSRRSDKLQTKRR